jgi:lipoyl(octanoyl) transferase
MTHADSDIDWTVADGLTDYATALSAMEARAAAIADGSAREQIWLLEHPPLYTAGTSADPAEMLDPRFPVFRAGRGGRYTYHGPGQRVGYVLLNLKARGEDVRCYVHALEGWVIAALADLGVTCWRAEGRVGIWTDDNGKLTIEVSSIANSILTCSLVSFETRSLELTELEESSIIYLSEK